MPQYTKQWPTDAKQVTTDRTVGKGLPDSSGGSLHVLQT